MTTQASTTCAAGGEKQSMVRLIVVAICLVAASFHQSAAALDIRIDVEAAERVLSALDGSNINPSTARKIARLPGNRALIRKQSSLD